MESSRTTHGALSAEDERFMREAIEEARAAAAEGEVPVGAVVVRDGKVVSRSHNRREADHDPSSHAEFAAIVEASRVLGRWRLSDCTVYVTLEPCLMCAGLMVNARIGRCVYGASDGKAGALGSLYRVNEDGRLNHGFEVTPGVLAAACSQELRDFFSRARTARSGDEAGRRRAERCALLEASPRPRGHRAPLPAPRVLIASDSFKGSATSMEVGEWVAEGMRRVSPDAAIRVLPVADGGEGTMDAVRSALGGTICEVEVPGPLGNPRLARYLLADAEEGAVAIVESAEAAGIAFSPRTLEAALRAGTRGVGEMVADAVRRGARTVYLGLGGSATSDGGAGFLRGLGARLLDGSGNDVPEGLEGLADIREIDLAPAVRAISGVRLIALGDVVNPMVGPRGAVRVFGPQKGLGRDGGRLEGLDDAMVSYSRILDDASRRFGSRPYRVLAGVPGSGAAGGMGAAVLALGGELARGIERVLDLVGFDAAVARCDLVVTGEGSMDGQTAGGKAPAGIAGRARGAGVPVVAVVGGRADDLGAVYREGIDLVLPISRRPMALERALDREETRRNLICAGETALRAYMLGWPLRR